MKKIEAIIRPSKLKAVQKGLKDAGIPCITAVPVKGTGLQKTFSSCLGVQNPHFHDDVLCQADSR